MTNRKYINAANHAVFRPTGQEHYFIRTETGLAYGGTITFLVLRDVESEDDFVLVNRFLKNNLGIDVRFSDHDFARLMSLVETGAFVKMRHSIHEDGTLSPIMCSGL